MNAEGQKAAGSNHPLANFRADLTPGLVFIHFLLMFHKNLDLLGYMAPVARAPYICYIYIYILDNGPRFARPLCPGIPRIYPGDPWEISQGSLGYIPGIPGIHPRDPQDISQGSPGYILGIPRIYPGDPWDISWGSLGCIPGIPGIYPRDPWDISQGSPGYILGIPGHKGRAKRGPLSSIYIYI